MGHMQEQSPLRPGFVRIRDGFIAFLKQPPGMPLETIIPQSAMDAMATAAKNGSKRRRRLEVARIAAATAAVAGTIVAVAFTPRVIGVAIRFSRLDEAEEDEDSFDMMKRRLSGGR